jgi:hypothetical protein
MSRYENIIAQHEELEKTSFEKDTFIDINRNDNEEHSSSDENNLEITSNQQIESIHQHSTDSLDYHSIEDNEQNISKPTTTISLFDRMKSFVSKPIEKVQEVIENRFNTEFLPTQQQQQQHFQSAYDLHDEEKSKLVRSPELYNIDNVIKHDHRSLLTNSQIQYRTLSESALTIDDSKRHSLTATTSNEASIEFLTPISKENSLEFIQQQQQQRLSTPFDDVLEKESSPEHSESYNIPTSAFSDAVEPTSSCQRPLAFSTSGQQRIITELEYQTVANDLVNQVLNDVITELTCEQDDSSLSNKLSTSSSTSSDVNDEILEEDEDESLIDNDRFIHNDLTSSKQSPHSSFSKILRRAQTDTKNFDIVQSPISLIPPIVRHNSQSNTETYICTISPPIYDYIPIDNSSSDEKSFNNKACQLFVDQNEKYSGEGEESSGGKERIIQRRKRSNDLSNLFESPSIKNVSFKFEINENFNREESLDSPPSFDSNENSIHKILQENILRTNLESFQIDLKLTNQQNEYYHQQTYSSKTKQIFSSYDYDGGSETDRDDSKIYQKFLSPSIDINIKNLLDDLIETINDDLSISSQSDATTVILNSNITSIDDEENSHDFNQTDKHCLSIPITDSSSSSSHSVIYRQQNLTSCVNDIPKKRSSIPIFSNIELTNHNTKKKFRSYPGSLVPITSIPSMPTTSTTFTSGN